MSWTIHGAPFNPTRIFCIGRNYAAHAAELENEIPEEPVVFMKPVSCLVPPGKKIAFPTHGESLHHEAELVVAIGQPGRPTEADAGDYVAGIGLGFDITLRDVQSRLKKKGLPWEIAKGFDGAAPLGPLVSPADLDLGSVQFCGALNGNTRQEGDTALMLFPIPHILAYLGSIWKLQPGDLVYTGTPKGVGPVERGDTITVSANWVEPASWTIV